MKKSTTDLLPQWYKTLASCGLSHHMMPCDVSTCWNSTDDMLLFALDFHPAIDSMTAKQDFDLQKYELSPAEWGIAKELRDVLKAFFLHSHHSLFTKHFGQVFKDVTLFFSHGTPNLAMAIPAMNHINKVLVTSSDRSQYSLSICVALIISKNAINQYYNKTDYSEIYCIAMSMSHFFHVFTTSYFKEFSTLVTSWPTSRHKVGKKHGLTLLTRLFMMSMFTHIHQCILMVAMTVMMTTSLWVPWIW